MKKWFIMMVAIGLLSGCMPTIDRNDEIVTETNNEQDTEKSIIPNFQISDSYYRSPVPLVPSKTRGLVVSNLNTSYDIQEFETGLMRVAKEFYSTETYLFQEGQILDKDTVNAWLRRKLTKEQQKEEKVENNLGLNPINEGKGDVHEQNEKSPIYLAHILEHDYLIKKEKTATLDGIVIGLALNSVHYYQAEKYGPTFEKKISHDKLAAEGKKIAEEVLKRLRSMEEVGDIPITIALFEQKNRNAVIPGNFFAYAHAGKGSGKLGEWKNIKEKTYLFPSSEAEEYNRDDVARFLRFKDDIEKYFPNYNGIIGKGFYKNDELVKLTIDIPIQLYGEAEIIGFSQLATSLVMDHFPDYFNVDVNVTSVNGAEALIVKKAGDKEPFVHIY